MKEKLKFIFTFLFLNVSGIHASSGPKAPPLTGCQSIRRAFLDASSVQIITGGIVAVGLVIFLSHIIDNKGKVTGDDAITLAITLALSVGWQSALKSITCT